jgi:hypothetical protein
MSVRVFYLSRCVWMPLLSPHVVVELLRIRSWEVGRCGAWQSFVVRTVPESVVSRMPGRPHTSLKDPVLVQPPGIHPSTDPEIRTHPELRHCIASFFFTVVLGVFSNDALERASRFAIL